MARVEIWETVIDGSGRPVGGAEVYVYDAGTTNETSVYAAESGGSPLVQPLLTSNGGIPGWVEEGSYDLDVSGTGISSATRRFNAVVGGNPALGPDSVDSSEIADDAVGSEHIQPDAVLNEHIADNAVDAAQIKADAVGTSEIAANAVGSSEIATNAVGSDEIAADAVGSSEIASGAVDTAELATGAVETDKLDDGAVTNAKVSSGISGSKLSDTSVSVDKLSKPTFYTSSGTTAPSSTSTWTNTGASYTAASTGTYLIIAHVVMATSSSDYSTAFMRVTNDNVQMKETRYTTHWPLDNSNFPITSFHWESVEDLDAGDVIRIQTQMTGNSVTAQVPSSRVSAIRLY